MKHRVNYTLVELLTVIAIIAILAGLLLPAINGARNSAKTATCQSNQKQTIATIIMSMNQEQNFFFSGDGNSDQNKYWSVHLYNKRMISDPTVLRCPSIKQYDAKTATNDTGWKNIFSETYGAIYTTLTTSSENKLDFRGTKYLTFKDSGGTIYDISPSNLVFGACSVNPAKRAKSVINLKGAAEANIGAPFGVHRNFANFFFMDGHVESLQEAEVNQKYAPETGNEFSDKVKANFQYD